MKDPNLAGCTGDHLDRRDFLRVGSLTFLGIHLSQYLQVSQALAQEGVRPRASAQACILVWLDGGQSQMDTWDPKPISSFRPISTNVPGIQISELLPRMARQMDKVALIRSMHTLENNHGVCDPLCSDRPPSQPGHEVSLDLARSSPGRWVPGGMSRLT